MAWFLGLDTSNYTTSAALYGGPEHPVIQSKLLLPVKDGALGLRQSDAVFSHIKQLGERISSVMEQLAEPVSGVGVSVRPRDAEGSYMPCFLVGELAAQTVSAVCRVPVVRVSHQSGHIMAALYSSGQLALVGREFAAFHLSGGTTECLLVHPDAERVFSVELLAHSLDLKAGQAVDRVGLLLGLPFPAGRHLEALALQSQKRFQIKSSFKGMDCSLSGVENRCAKMLADGESHCDIARFCIESILAAVSGMTEQLKNRFGDIPIVYSGGVMSNSIIRERITARFGGFFAEPAYSSDNAAGVAILTRTIMERGEKP